VEVRELDSVMKVASGGIMVIGGLMEDVTRNSSEAVPGLGEMPIVGNLFKSRSEDSSKRELIIFIKATIVNPDGSADRIDRKVYNKFVTDPRPLFGPQK
jgi:type II secretory pathway component GspD/PulD (secretin)